jgi:hypothetical protein
MTIFTIKLQTNMNTRSKLATSLLLVIISLVKVPSAVSQPSQNSACSEALPKSYREPTTTKYVKIPQLGITVRVPKDRRLVYDKESETFTFMSPTQYKNYQCSLDKKLNTEQMGRSNPFINGFTVSKNLKRKPLSDFIVNIDYAENSPELQPSFKSNNIEFVTQKGGSISTYTLFWFVPRSKPDIVVEYRYDCNNRDCANDFFGTGFFKNIFNAINK